MILGIGIDIVEVARFAEWKSYSIDRLSNVFSEKEIAVAPKQKTGEYYASRFAAKEAFFKALSNALIALEKTHQSLSFQFARQHIEVVKGTWEVPQLAVNWQAFEEKIGQELPPIQTHLSFAHEKIHAIAMVILTR